MIRSFDRKLPDGNCERDRILGMTARFGFRFLQSNLAKHLSILRDSGLVASHCEGTRVRCQVTNPRVFVALDAVRAATHAQLEAITLSFAAAAQTTVQELGAALEESTC